MTVDLIYYKPIGYYHIKILIANRKGTGSVIAEFSFGIIYDGYFRGYF